MASKAIDFLESYKSETPSQFMDDVKWRKENESWLRWSRQLATALIGYMQVARNNTHIRNVDPVMVVLNAKFRKKYISQVG